MQRKGLWLLFSISAITGFSLIGCVSADEVAVNKKDGFHYGFGTAKLEADAQALAMDDLIYNVLTETGSIKKDKKTKVQITPEMRAAFVVFKLKPSVSEKNKDKSFNIVYQLSEKDWVKAETARLAGLRADLGERFQRLKGDKAASLESRIAEAGKLWVAINRNGVTLSLKESETATTPLSLAIEAFGKDLADRFAFKAMPDTGLVAGGQPIQVTVSDKGGKPLANLTVSYIWHNGNYGLPVAQAKTDNQGTAAIKYPADDTFRNRKASLEVATVIGVQAPDVPWIVALDAPLKAKFSYRNAEELGQTGSNEVLVAGGSFTTGMVKQDRRASRNEVARSINLKSFYIDKYLVTNAQYLAYLEATNAPRDSWPEYWENEEYNQPNQPVIGITIEQAKKYAAWISGVLGYAKRLPTEDEYEVAARGGQAVLYPWGDEPPTDGVRANYSGNQRFTGPSPVGSFENGQNPLGLHDMVGNVWEWTTSEPDANMTVDPGLVIVKGGSWMDGPNELRISARRAVNPTEAASDIGFRLVREASNE